MSQKIVNFSIEELMPLAQEVMEFLIKKQKDPSGVTPEEIAMNIGALELAHIYFQEEMDRFGGKLTSGPNTDEIGH